MQRKKTLNYFNGSLWFICMWEYSTLHHYYPLQFQKHWPPPPFQNFLLSDEILRSTPFSLYLLFPPHASKTFTFTPTSWWETIAYSGLRGTKHFLVSDNWCLSPFVYYISISIRYVLNWNKNLSPKY